MTSTSRNSMDGGSNELRPSQYLLSWTTVLECGARRLATTSSLTDSTYTRVTTVATTNNDTYHTLGLTASCNNRGGGTSDFSLQLYPGKSSTSVLSGASSSGIIHRPTSFWNQPRSIIIDHAASMDFSTPTSSMDEDEFSSDDFFNNISSLLGVNNNDDDDDNHGSGLSSLESLDHTLLYYDDDEEEFDTDEYMPTSTTRGDTTTTDETTSFVEQLRAGLTKLMEKAEEEEEESTGDEFFTDDFMLPPPATINTSVAAFHPFVMTAATAQQTTLVGAIEINSDDDDDDYDDLEELEFDTDDFLSSASTGTARSLMAYAQTSPPQRPAKSLSELQQQQQQQQYLAAFSAATTSTNPYFSPQRQQTRSQLNYSSAVHGELEPMVTDGVRNDLMMEEISTQGYTGAVSSAFYHPEAASAYGGAGSASRACDGGPTPEDIEASVCFLVVDDDEEEHLEWDR